MDRSPDGWQIFEYTTSGWQILLVILTNCTDCDMAQRYVNKQIAIDRSAFPEAEDGTITGLILLAAPCIITTKANWAR